MAELHKFTVQEALNASQGSAGSWTPAEVETVNASGGDTGNLALSNNTHLLLLQPTVETQISFDTAAANIDTDDDISIPANTLTSIVVPRGLGNTIVLNFGSDSGTAGTMRIVEI